MRDPGSIRSGPLAWDGDGLRMNVWPRKEWSCPLSKEQVQAGRQVAERLGPGGYGLGLIRSSAPSPVFPANPACHARSLPIGDDRASFRAIAAHSLKIPCALLVCVHLHQHHVPYKKVRCTAKLLLRWASLKSAWPKLHAYEVLVFGPTVITAIVNNSGREGTINRFRLAELQSDKFHSKSRRTPRGQHSNKAPAAWAPPRTGRPFSDPLVDRVQDQ